MRSSFYKVLTRLSLFALLLNVTAVPVLAAGVDSDGDGLYDEDEAALGFDPTIADTDGNGTADGFEDNDSDGLLNLSELYTWSTDPSNPDTDGDGRGDYNEVLVTPTTDPNNVDTDGDGLYDNELLNFGTNPNSLDTDGDGLGDYYEEVFLRDAGYPTFSGSVFDSYLGGGVSDGSVDLDGDGLSFNQEQITYGTDPLDADSDDDGLDDGTEIARGTDPNVPQLPDLVVMDIRLNGANAVVYDLSNQGNANLPPALNGYTTITLDGVVINNYLWSLLADKSFLMSGVVQTDFATSVIVPDGTHRVVVCVDTTDVAVELTNSNNCLAKDFTVNNGGSEGGSGGSVSTPLPDLTLGAPTIDVNGTLSFTVSNNGTADISASALPFFTIKENTVVLLEDELTDYSTAFFTMNSTGTVNVSGLSYSTGTINLEVCVDLKGDVSELNEGNNCSGLIYDTANLAINSPTTSTTGGGGGVLIGGGQSSNSGSTVVLTSDEEDVVLTGEEENCGTMNFVDVFETTEGFDAIRALWCQGDIHGRDATHFAPEDTIKRDEATKVISRLFGFVTIDHNELPEVTETSYQDVSTEEPLAYYVETMTEEGYFEEEKTEETFRPHEDMNFGDIVDLLEEVSGMEVNTEDEYEENDSMQRGRFVEFVFGLFQ